MFFRTEVPHSRIIPLVNLCLFGTFLSTRGLVKGRSIHSTTCEVGSVVLRIVFGVGGWIVECLFIGQFAYIALRIRIFIFGWSAVVIAMNWTGF